MRASIQSLQKALSVVEKTIHGTEKREIIVKEVYELLDNVFGQNPWPVPPCAILFHLELSPGASAQEREHNLRELIRKDRRVRHGSQWEFKKFYHRHYAFHPEITKVGGKNWAKFLMNLTPFLGSISKISTIKKESELKDADRLALLFLTT